MSFCARQKSPLAVGSYGYLRFQTQAAYRLDAESTHQQGNENPPSDVRTNCLHHFPIIDAPDRAADLYGCPRGHKSVPTADKWLSHGDKAHPPCHAGAGIQNLCVVPSPQSR
ncbi:Uncharacterised protein [Vibrio cholerae]|nr:Uncharacterised protein [Vibrio cholerae]CSI33106.1 Uncharacterised protein [Vibrio cholerae]